MAHDLDRLFKYVEAALEATPRITLAALSRQLNVNFNVLEDAVARGSGTTFSALQNKILLEKSRQLLANPSLSIKEVSYEIGFSRPDAFGRFIKAASGLTPKELRKRQAARAPVPMGAKPGSLRRSPGPGVQG